MGIPSCEGAKSRHAQMITRRAKNLYTDLKVNGRRKYAKERDAYI